MAHSGAAVGIAAISGPAFSGIISARMGQEFVYMVVAFLMVLGLILSFILKPIVKDTVDSFEEKPSLQGFIELFKIKGLLIGLIGGITLAASQGILAYMLPLKVVELGIADHMSAMLVSILELLRFYFSYYQQIMYTINFITNTFFLSACSSPLYLMH